jgi:hypothetical protein
MFCCIKPPRKPAASQAVPVPVLPTAVVVQPASLEPPCLPLPQCRSTFGDLPQEIVCDIADHVFQAAIHDPSYDVSSLACNPSLESTLSHELHASRVLRNIQASRDLCALSRALVDVPGVFSRYRNGCLIAAIGLLPKLGGGRQAPQALWSQLRALLPPHTPCRNSEDAASFEAVLHALIETFRPTRRGFGSFMGLEHVLATIPAGSAVSPQLETALVRWAVDRMQYPGFDARYTRKLGERLVPAAPVVMRARMQNLFDFFEGVQSGFTRPTVETMACQMREMEAAQAADDPDQRLKLQVLSRSWFHRMRHLPECEALYRGFFARLDPEQQLWLVQLGQSPLERREILSFLQAQVGRAPGTKLLKAMALDVRGASGETRSETSAGLVRDIVRASVHTPQQAAVLKAAICFETVNWFHLHAFFEQCVAESPEADRLALSLRLGLAEVGCGEFAPRKVAERAPVCAQLNKVLDDSRNIDPRAIETIVELRIEWLDRKQKNQLFERIGQLPPADSARCLATAISHLASTRRVEDLPLPHTILDACRRLPPEHQAEPVTALLDLLYNPEFRTCGPLLRGALQLYENLPPAFRPEFRRQRAEAMQAVTN